MLYPLKFASSYKDYIWGGRNLEKIGKQLPEGKVAESWEISCHPAGVSIVSNGIYKGVPLPDLIKSCGRSIIGASLNEGALLKFPLLIKLIDANDKLSVQVHPNDDYAAEHENGESGKDEMWYVISAKPGARLVYDVLPGTTKESFTKAVYENRIEDCLKYIPVSEGDVIDIPAGLVHAIGEGILLAEVQQNSNATYRVFDYNRLENGIKRPLHIEKALDVIDFNFSCRQEKIKGLSVDLGPASTKRCIIANRHFAVEVYDVDGSIEETADGSRFYTYTIINGHAVIRYGSTELSVKCGESVLIPASLGEYSIEGILTAIKAYVPDIIKNVVNPLLAAGHKEDEIKENVGGMKHFI